MKRTTLAAVAVAVLLLTAGAATAIPDHAGSDASPDDNTNGTTVADDHTQSDGTVDEGQERDGQDAEAGDGAQENESGDQAHESRGPPSDLPAQVPDHVTTIHDLIREFLSGGMTGDGLGSAVSGTTPGNGTGAVDG